MKPIKMSAKRWFWSLMAAGLCWSYAGWQWDGDPQDAGALRRTQYAAGVPAELALIPPTFLATRAQQFLASAVRPTGAGSANADELRNQVAALQNENAQLKAMILDASARLTALGQLQQQYQIAPQDVVPATITSWQAGPGASIMRLDRGSNSGVKEGAPVMAPFERICLLGKVSKVGPVSCEVRLVSDPASKVLVQIVRPQIQKTPGGPVVQDIVVTQQPSLLDGKGDNRMEINGINVADAQPQKGDLVCLTDRAWWGKTQHMVLGQIDAVGRQDNQPLRYTISVSPRVPTVTLGSVMILIKE